MAYVIVYHKDQEVARRRLDGAVTIGRSIDCELSVHDILLSRKHCRVEPEGDGWVVMDLGSKNGTRVGGTPVFRLPLNDGDVIRMGKTAVRFRTGEFLVSAAPKTSGIKRPADPFEAMAGTVTDFSYKPTPVIAPNGIPLPTPKPVPLEPAAYAHDDVRSLVSELVSSSWDSIYESASSPGGVAVHEPLVAAVRRRRSREPRVHVELQVRADVVLKEPLPAAPLEEAENDRGALPQESARQRIYTPADLLRVLGVAEPTAAAEPSPSPTEGADAIGRDFLPNLQTRRAARLVARPFMRVAERLWFRRPARLAA